jgi:hypothetical protein
MLALAACDPTPVSQPDAPATVAMGDTFNLAVGQTATVLPEQIDITLNRILEDSRCPSNVSCFWSGQLIVEISVVHAGVPAGTFQLNSIDAYRFKDRPTFESYNLALLKATPSRFYENFGKPDSTIHTPAESEYVMSMQITQVTQGIVPANRAEVGQLVKLPIGQTADYGAEGLTVRFQSLVEDTRCPKSPLIACYQSGIATIQTVLTKDAQSRTVNLVIPGLVDDTRTLPERSGGSAAVVDFAGYRVRLVSLDPMPMDLNPSTPKADPSTYVATLLVTAG